jgi:hypothetical protein
VGRPDGTAIEASSSIGFGGFHIDKDKKVEVKLQHEFCMQPLQKADGGGFYDPHGGG